MSRLPQIAWLLLWLSAFFASPHQLSGSDQRFGTTAIVGWSPNLIVLGVDGKTTFVTRGERVGSMTECKIKVQSSYYILAAGIYRSRRTRFDAWSTLTKAASSGQSFARTVISAEKAVMTSLTEVVSGFSVQERDFYRRQNVYLEFAIAGFEHGKPLLSLRGYYPGDGLDQIDTNSLDYPGERAITAKSRGFVTLGERDAIDSYKISNPRWFAEEPVSLIRRLIRLQISASPEKVGEPLSILRLLPEGPDWVIGGACASK